MPKIFVIIKKALKHFDYATYNILAGYINLFQISVFSIWDHEKKNNKKINYQNFKKKKSSI